MFYFAYGMNLYPDYMPGATKIGPAVLHGWALEFQYYANILEREGAFVPGGLWSVPDLNMLDQREGYPVLYDRRTVTVSLEDVELEDEWHARNVEAVVYFMRQRGALEPPDEGYLTLITEGRAHFGLGSTDVLAAAKLAAQS
jgi:hypothetical protein